MGVRRNAGSPKAEVLVLHPNVLNVLGVSEKRLLRTNRSVSPPVRGRGPPLPCDAHHSQTVLQDVGKRTSNGDFFHLGPLIQDWHSQLYTPRVSTRTRSRRLEQWKLSQTSQTENLNEVQENRESSVKEKKSNAQIILDLPDDLTPSARDTLSNVLDGQFKLGKKLGSGISGEVFHVLQTQTGASYAIKASQSGNELALYNEAAIMHSVAHSNVVGFRFLQTRPGDSRAAIGIGMEYCDSGSVLAALESSMMRKDITATSPPFDFYQRWSIIRDVASALAHIHSKGVCHGDVKTDNILLKNNGFFSRIMTAKLADFGHARLRSDAVVTIPHGHPQHQPPELLPSQLPSYMQPHHETGILRPSADIWALGVVMWELLSRLEDPAGQEWSTAGSRGTLDDVKAALVSRTAFHRSQQLVKAEAEWWLTMNWLLTWQEYLRPTAADVVDHCDRVLNFYWSIENTQGIYESATADSMQYVSSGPNDPRHNFWARIHPRQVDCLPLMASLDLDFGVDGPHYFSQDAGRLSVQVASLTKPCLGGFCSTYKCTKYECCTNCCLCEETLASATGPQGQVPDAFKCISASRG